MKKEIIQHPDHILRRVSEEIPLTSLPNKEVLEMIKDMKDTLDAEEDGVALSAIQIGIPKKIFIVSPKAFDEENEKEAKYLICINPKIIKSSKKTKWLDEGCLSIRNIYGEVERSNQVTIEAYDENGKKFTRGASGLVAQVFQHESDHLNGVLFIDKAINVREIDPSKNVL